MLAARVLRTVKGTGANIYELASEWTVSAWSGQNGGTAIAFLYDVDSDGELEMVCNVGSQATFFAFKEDGTVVWSTTINATQHKHAYYPRLYDGHIYYGDRNAEKVYAVRVTDGVKVWEASTPGIQCINYCNQGVVVGHTNAVDILAFSTGLSIGGNWPVNPGFTPHEQVLAVGDLDGDGQDEVFCNGQMNLAGAGTIKAIDHDGTILFTLSSLGNIHVDNMWIFDVNGDGNNELVATVDEDDSTGVGEGDEIAVYNSSGVQLDKITIGRSINFIAGNVGDSGRVVYGLENAYLIGVLDGNLDLVWEHNGADVAGATSSALIADVDGDGVMEVIYNTGELTSSGFGVRDGNTGRLMAYETGQGVWPFAPNYKYGDSDSFAARDIDPDNDGNAELVYTKIGSNDTTSVCTLYVWEWKR